MRLVTYLEKNSDIELYKRNGVNEVIIGVKEFSRFGKLSVVQANSIAKAALEAGLKPVLEWDILMTQNVFAENIQKMSEVDFTLFKEVRTQDPGATEWIKTNRPETKIALLLETGNHNWTGIEKWCDYLGAHLSKVVLSIELPYEKIAQYSKLLKEKNIRLEFLGLGRILLFYTPRSLLAPVVFDHDDEKKRIFHGEMMERLASSEESPHKGFPVVETLHGTFMFHVKDHWLMEHIQELNEMGLDDLRIDLRFGKDTNLIQDVATLIANFSKDKALALKEKYPADVIRGFFHVNKTDSLFTKLKNMKLQRKDENYLGDVYEVIKERQIIFMNRSRNKMVTLGMPLTIINPDGKEIQTTVKSLKNSEGMEVTSIGHEELAVINFAGTVVARSQVYLRVE